MIAHTSLPICYQIFSHSARKKASNKSGEIKEELLFETLMKKNPPSLNRKPLLLVLSLRGSLFTGCLKSIYIKEKTTSEIEFDCTSGTWKVAKGREKNSKIAFQRKAKSIAKDRVQG